VFCSFSGPPELVQAPADCMSYRGLRRASVLSKHRRALRISRNLRVFPSPTLTAVSCTLSLVQLSQLFRFRRAGKGGRGGGSLQAGFRREPRIFLGSEFGTRDPSSCVGLVLLCILVVFSAPELHSRPMLWQCRFVGECLFIFESGFFNVADATLGSRGISEVRTGASTGACPNTLRHLQ
jgi:hypothetical protein